MRVCTRKSVRFRCDALIWSAHDAGYGEALDLLDRFGATFGPVWDESTASNVFEYVDPRSGTRHQVWYESPQSLQVKYAAFVEAGVLGVGMWIGSDFHRGDPVKSKAAAAAMWAAVPELKAIDDQGKQIKVDDEALHSRGRDGVHEVFVYAPPPKQRGLRWAVNFPDAVEPFLLGDNPGHWANTSRSVADATVGIVVQPVFSIPTSGELVTLMPAKLPPNSSSLRAFPPYFCFKIVPIPPFR